MTYFNGNYLISHPVAVSPVEYLRELAGDDFDLLNCIAEKESHWRMVWNYMHDIDADYYSAFGFFQITVQTAKIDPTLDRTQPFDNVKLAVEIFNKRGVSPWLVAPLCK